MRKKIFLFLLLIITGCASQPADNTAEALYKNKCGGCHRLYKKEDFSSEKWGSILPAMSRKAHLTEAEEKTIGTFLIK